MTNPPDAGRQKSQGKFVLVFVSLILPLAALILGFFAFVGLMSGSRFYKDLFGITELWDPVAAYLAVVVVMAVAAVWFVVGVIVVVAKASRQPLAPD